LIVKIHGPPGTGKTTTLCKIIKYYQEKGVKLKNIMYISFSNAAIESIYSKLGLPYKVKNKSRKIPYFRTIHGICLSYLMKFKEYRENLRKLFCQPNLVDSYYLYYCRSQGIAYDPDLMSDDLGNRAINLWTRIVSDNFPGKTLTRCLDILKNTDEECYEVIEGWFKYKKEKKILDWVDILVAAYYKDINFYNSNIKLALVDEAQDFNRLEYILLSKILRGIPTVFFAGDVNQAIYLFKGAKPEFLYNLKADREFSLKKTYRMSSEVVKFSTKILESMELKKIVNLEPRCEGGNVALLHNPVSLSRFCEFVVKYALTNIKKSVFLLVRTNYIMKTLLKEMFNLGYLPLMVRNDPIWNIHFPRVYIVMRKISKGVSLTPEEKKWVVELLPISKKKKEILMSNIDKLDVSKIFNKGTLSKISSEGKRCVLKEMLNRRVFPYSKNTLFDIITNCDKYYILPNLKIGTFHSSKGLEADSVIILDGLTNKVLNSLSSGETTIDDELRNYYVAATRARDEVIVMTCTKYKPFLTKIIS